MKMKPIIFSTAMTKAILEGRKKQTRRAIKPQPTPYLSENDGGDYWNWNNKLLWPHRGFGSSKYQNLTSYAPYKPGDILYVKETWSNSAHDQFGALKLTSYAYKASDVHSGRIWKSSRYMPKEAARIFLQVVDVRVECLCQIATSDAIAEGFSSGERESETDAFYKYWNKLNTKRGYGKEKNPWVWVIEFERTEMP